MGLRPGQAKGPWVGTTGGGSGGDLTQADNENQGIRIDADGRIEHGIAGFYDDFIYFDPFWTGKPILTSGDWQWSSGFLLGIAENNQYDAFRYNIHGDADYAMKVQNNNATSIGFRFYDEKTATSARIFKTGGGDVTAQYSTESDVTANNVAPDPATCWLRIRKYKYEVSFYYRLADDGEWVLLVTYEAPSPALNYPYRASLDSAQDGKIYEVRFYDDQFPIKTYVNELTDAATIIVDASAGDMHSVTLGGNRTLGNPSYARGDGQMLLFRIKQDGTGSRTLSYGTSYRFSSGLPSPTLSTGSGSTDYLLFVYNRPAGKWDFVGKVFGF